MVKFVKIIPFDKDEKDDNETYHLYGKTLEEIKFINTCKDILHDDYYYYGIYGSKNAKNLFDLLNNCYSIFVNNGEIYKHDETTLVKMSLNRPTESLDLNHSLSVITGDRRLFISTMLKDLKFPELADVKTHMIQFEKESLTKIRDNAVFTNTKAEISGFFYWDQTKKCMKSSLNNSCVGNKGTESAEVSMFYLEYHTHPLYVHLRGTDEFVNIPSTSDYYSLQKEYVEGNVAALIFSVVGIFTTWIDPVFQKAILFSGKSDVRKSNNEVEKEASDMEIFDILQIFENSKFKRTKDKKLTDEHKSLAFGGGIWKIVHKAFGDYIMNFSAKLLGGKNGTICSSKDVKDCFYKEDSAKLWCMYRSTTELEDRVDKYAKSLEKFMTVKNLYRNKIGLKEWGSEKFENIYKDAFVTLELLGESVETPLIRSKFTSWSTVENDKNDKIDLLPASLFKDWLSPSDRFLNATTVKKQDSKFPSDSAKFVHLDSGRPIRYFGNDLVEKWEKMFFRN